MKIAVSAETTVDLTKELLQKFDIHTTPFTIILGDEVKLDGEVGCEEIIDYVNKTCRNILDNTAVFKKDEKGVRGFKNFLASINITEG